MPSSAASPGLAKKSPVLRPAGSVLPVGDVAARWYEIARENGKDAVRCDVPGGRPVRAETVETAHDREACECRRSRAQRDKHGRAEPARGSRGLAPGTARGAAARRPSSDALLTRRRLGPTLTSNTLEGGCRARHAERSSDHTARYT